VTVSSDKDIIKQFDDHKDRTSSGLAKQYKTAEEDMAFFAGDKMYYEASVNDKARKRMVVFNKVKPFVSAVAGFMIQTRRKPNYLAKLKESEEQQLRSQYMNNISDYIRDNANMDQIETQQDIDMLTVGYGAVDANVDYERNPDGEVIAQRINPLDAGWDPQAREPNLLDARWVYRRKKYMLKEAMDIFDDAKAEDFEPDNQGSATQPEYFPLGGIVDKIAFDRDPGEKDMINVYYYQWWEREKYYRVVNPIYNIPDTQAAMIVTGKHSGCVALP